MINDLFANIDNNFPVALDAARNLYHLLDEEYMKKQIYVEVNVSSFLYAFMYTFTVTYLDILLSCDYISINIDKKLNDFEYNIDDSYKIVDFNDII